MSTALEAREPPRLRLPRTAVWAGTVALAALAATVVLLLLGLGTSRELNDNVLKTNQKLDRLQRTVTPLSTEAPPFLREGRPFLRETTSQFETTLALIERMEPVLLAIADAAVPVLRRLQPIDLARVLLATGDAAALFGQLVRREGLPATVRRLRDLLAEVRRRELTGDLDRALATLPRLERGIDELRRLSRTSVRGLEESLVLQRESLEHLRNIDRKTGGDLPVPP